jgi:chemotaxis protein CheX
VKAVLWEQQNGEKRIMDKIAAIDCGQDVFSILKKMLGDAAGLSSESFEGIQDLQNYRMIIIEEKENQRDLLQRIRKLRYACYFREVPIILINKYENNESIEPYLTSGATEVLSLQEPIPAIQQILKGYLIPNRKPLVEEMDYISSFIKNTRNVISTTASVEPIFKEVYFTNDFRVFGDISGIIGLSGEAEGILGITFYWPLAKMIIAKMMSVSEEQINADLIHDGVAEIINMISGSTKKDFVGKPYHFEISLPSVIVGSGHQIGHADNTSIAVMIFEVSYQYFALQVCIRPRANIKVKASSSKI